MSAIRILLADDHAVIRAGLHTMIDAQSDMELVGEAEDAISAVEKAVSLKPDVAVLDLSMPKGGGTFATKEIRRQVPGTRILILTMHDDISHVRTALSLGADGYVVKNAQPSELLGAIRAVHNRRSYIDVSLADEALPDSIRQKERKERHSQGVEAIDLLSPREREVLKGIAQGLTNRDIAGNLGVSVKTVETHRSRLCDKLGLKKRMEIVRYALACDILSKDDST